MTYWLVNSGTTDDPLSSRSGAVLAAFENWAHQRGEVHGLDKAYGMRRGDILVYRTVGHPVSRLVAYAEVLGPPQPRPFLRWKYAVPRNPLAVVETLRNGPGFDVLDTPPVRVTKRLDDATGALATRLIDEAVANPRTR